MSKKLTMEEALDIIRRKATSHNWELCPKCEMVMGSVDRKFLCISCQEFFDIEEETTNAQV